MALPNPLQFLVFPFVLFVAFPLALCAGFTTIFAFLVLFARLFLVYFDVGLETLRYVLLGHAAQTRYIASQRTPSASLLASADSSPLPSPNPDVASPRHKIRRKRRSSVTVSGRPVTPPGKLNGLAFTSTTGLDRDFEGIGGWRLDSVDMDAQGADEQEWYALNSRLEVLERRHHMRSHSGGAILPGTGNSGMGMQSNRAGSRSPEGLRMTTSPNSSRSRTPTNGRPQSFTKREHDSYFPTCEEKGMKNVSI
ncbi:hypothetical protein F5Y15DRAFT_361067 [Xylariaceae sp. FL0016]|nr:hypothetical protein F5Y15DRAFT_361067 [Xylariaceae sp. FL0016]